MLKQKNFRITLEQNEMLAKLVKDFNEWTEKETGIHPNYSESDFIRFLITEAWKKRFGK